MAEEPVITLQGEEEFPLVQLLEDDGNLREEFHLPDDVLLKMYRTMVLNRVLDERLFKLQRQGRIGFYLTLTGEEAAVVGSVAALDDQDWLFPAYRETALALWRGVDLVKFISQIYGNAYDNVKGRQMPNHYSFRELKMVSISSPVGTQIPQAMGFAWAARIVRDPVVVMVYFGDGATSEGDFHVGLNFAGVFKTPTIFFCRNNQWAISLHRDQQTASETIAQKAVAYGIHGVRVDGNDVLAVYKVTKEAVERARAGKGATLIEAVTYRLGAHSSSDDPRRYRDEQEVEYWQKHDPITRFKTYLVRQGLWDDEKDQALFDEAEKTVMEAVKKAESIGPPALETLFTDVYKDKPWHIEEQEQAYFAFLKEKEKWLG